MYAINGTIRRKNDDGWEITITIPTFYLDSSVQGIVDTDHAIKIATEIVDPLGLLSKYAKLHLFAVKI